MALSPYLNKPVRTRKDAANDVRLDREETRKVKKSAKRKSRVRTATMLQRVKRLVS